MDCVGGSQVYEQSPEWINLAFDAPPPPFLPTRLCLAQHKRYEKAETMQVAAVWRNAPNEATSHNSRALKWRRHSAPLCCYTSASLGNVNNAANSIYFQWNANRRWVIIERRWLWVPARARWRWNLSEMPFDVQRGHADQALWVECPQWPIKWASLHITLKKNKQIQTDDCPLCVYPERVPTPAWDLDL